jgi:diguanylate cyclase (GGDEF)-like protein
MALTIFGGCSTQRTDLQTKAEDGSMDITQLQFENDIVQLDGKWEFYWKQLLDPSELKNGILTGYIDVPKSWNKLISDEDYKPGYGYATYRLTIATEKYERLAIKIPRIRTAYKLWINGELYASSGTVGKTREMMIPQYLPQVAIFEAQQGKNEIVIQISNFHQRNGGMLESIKLGSEKQILGLRYKSIANELLLFGSLIFIGAYHLSLFFFRKKNKSPLYFGMFCILVAMRTLLVGECFLIYLFPDFNWEIAHKIQTLTFYLGVPLILMFFMSVFPKYFHEHVIKTAKYMGAAFGLLVLLTQARVFTVVNPLYQVWTIIVIIYVLAMLIKISIHNEKGSSLITIGALALLLTSLNDIIFLSIWMNDYEPSFLKDIFRIGNLSSAGQFIFAFTNSLLLAKKFSSSLEQEEVMTAKLTEINLNLDELVSQRTKALEDSVEKIKLQKLELKKVNRELLQRSLKDPLTCVWNRRKYDETIKLEWLRCLRYQRPIALILLDIDYFKQLNDTYGHVAGDECLVKIGETLKSSLSRSTDMVARYGGEEFVVLLTETGKEESIKIAEMLRQKIEALNIQNAQSSVCSCVTVSIGVTYTIPNNNFSHNDLFKIADKALYEAKAAGRNQVKFLFE